MGKRKQNKVVERVKTRKELRKDKRLQKKANRVHFQKRKKEMKLEHKARLNTKTNGKNGKTPAADSKNQTKQVDDDNSDVDADDGDDGDEIESDFELSDAEMEQQTNAAKKTKIEKAPKYEPTQLERDHQRSLKQEQTLRKDMRKQRINQLKSANEEEDKTIRKLEKLLKLDKTKSKKSVPRMFHDGLDYALEMCLPENIEKMYAAAKEAADADAHSDSEWQEDFALATGGTNVTTNGSKRKASTNDIMSSEVEPIATSAKSEKSRKRLKKIESKYFAESDDELASDLSGVDSEFEQDDDDGDEGDEIEGSADSDDDDDDDDADGSDDEEGEEEDEDEEMESLDGDEEIGENDELDNLLNSSDSEASVADDREDEEPKTWEDIYGRKRDQDGNVIVESPATGDETKYVPPHMRARLAAAAAASSTDGCAPEMDPKRKEKLLRLKKLLKGNLNRLSEANMHKIATDIDNLYMQNSRHDMNDTLATLIIDALVTNVLAPERMVMEHMMLVAVLHANVGMEVGAHMLEVVIDRFHHLFQNGIDSYEVEDKSIDNLILILCHMYTFKIFQHNLITEILIKLAETLCEKSAECLLLALRSIGFALRKDDPVALKDLILLLQKKTSEASDELRNNARLKYMLDVLLAIKNNNVNKIPQYDPTLAEHLRKIVKTLLVNGKYLSTLKITFNDLVNAKARGKWWVVGSAWTGNIKDIGGANTPKSTKKDEQKFSEQLLELARKQRMNTEERRNVFCVLMSAEDYIDAFEKLLHLAIKDQRVIVSVIVHCCLSETTFNRYYAVLMQKFCDFDRKYQLAVQYAIWDRIKDIQSHSVTQSKNLAQLIVHLVSSAAQPISILKIVEFGALDKTLVRLVRQVLLGILLAKEELCKEVFQRIAPSDKLKAFKDSIRLFMHHFLIKGSAKIGIEGSQLDLLKERIKLADKSLDTSALRF